jgi:hypothetical protein
MDATTTGNEIIILLIKSWPGILFFAGAIFNAGATFYMVKSIPTRISDLEEDNESIRDEIKKRLYDDKSQPIYMPAIACQSCRTSCDQARIKDISYLAETLREYGKTQNLLNNNVVKLTENMNSLILQFNRYIEHAPPQHTHDEHGIVIRGR